MGQDEETVESEAKDTSSKTTESDTDAVLDVDAATETESVEELRETVEEQQEQIDELNDLLLDLSTRVADGNSMGVCPDCHGAVLKVSPWFRPAKIKCVDCERVFHTY